MQWSSQAEGASVNKALMSEVHRACAVVEFEFEVVGVSFGVSTPSFDMIEEWLGYCLEM